MLSSQSQAIHWHQIFKKFKDSGKTIKKFCEVNNISLHQFMYWRKKLILSRATNHELSDDKSTMLRKITTTPSNNSYQQPLKIIFPNGVLLSIPNNIDQNTTISIFSNAMENLC